MIFIVLFALTKLLLSQVFLGTMKLRVNNKSHWFIKSFKSFFFVALVKLHRGQTAVLGFYCAVTMTLTLVIWDQHYFTL